MIKTLINYFTNPTTDNVHTIKNYFNGFAIVDRNNTVVAGPYSRERDAKRGATRRGLTLA